MSKWLNSLQPCGALFMRLVLGIAIAMYGYQKVVPHGALTRHVHMVAGIGLPAWLGYVSAYAELIGGILLILGLFTRLAAAFIAINMFVAFFTVGIHHGLGSFDYTLAFAAIAVMLLFYGPGALAIDRKIGFS
jgi:putative oxidoreductase